MTSHTTYLHRIEPALNCYRYYALSLQPGLFEEWSLTRSWGRMGTKGRHLIVWFPSREQAERVYERTRRAKLRRGYRPTLFPLAPLCHPPSPRRQDTARRRRTSSQRPNPPQRTSAGQQELFSLGFFLPNAPTKGNKEFRERGTMHRIA
jgi:predicted DNA-binding WGR domain protein